MKPLARLLAQGLLSRAPEYLMAGFEQLTYAGVIAELPAALRLRLADLETQAQVLLADMSDAVSPDSPVPEDIRRGFREAHDATVAAINNPSSAAPRKPVAFNLADLGIKQE